MSEGAAQNAAGTNTHCPYCAFQCGMSVTGGRSPQVSGNASFPVNEGALCVKGWSAAELLNHPDRLLAPLVRNAEGQLQTATWSQALSIIADRVTKVQGESGRDAVAVFGSGSLTNEKAYLLGKFARVGLGTPNIDYNGRFCMSSAAAAATRSLGVDRGLPFPLDDIRSADAILLVGANIAETMPPFMQYFDAMRRNGGRLIVADPRATRTASTADLHLQNRPGTDAALAIGLLHILIRDGRIDRDYIAARTEGYEAVRAIAASYWPGLVEQITGVPQGSLEQAAATLGSARRVMILTGRGPEQQSHGVDNVSAFINIALALGSVGRAGSGYGCLTGQGNGQGGREHGLKADQLPGYRRIDDQQAREHVASVWGVDPTSIPGPGRPAYQLLESLGQEHGPRAMFVFGSNPAVSAPNASLITERLRGLDLLVVADFFLSETAQLADVVLPTAQWAEEEGTTTNLEGRVVLRKRAVAPPPNVLTDIEIICAIACRLGQGSRFDFDGPAAVFEELRRASRGAPADYYGITYEKIESQNGVFWPCPAEEHPGTARLFTERFPTASGRAMFVPVRHHGAAEETDGEYPVYLTTGRVLAQYQSGNQTRRVERLSAISPAPQVEIHPSTAARNHLQAGATARVTTRRGVIDLPVRISHSIRPDTVFIPFHWGEGQAVNRLTNPALDPVSSMPEFKVCAARIELLPTANGTELT